MRRDLDLFGHNPPFTLEEQEWYNGIIKDLDEILEYKRQRMVVRAKMDWAIKGDIPTRYFFVETNQRSRKINIRYVWVKRRREFLNDPKGIHAVFTEASIDLFNLGDNRDIQIWNNWCKENPRRMEEGLVELVRHVEEEECYGVISMMQNNKSLGKDGILVELYKSC